MSGQVGFGYSGDPGRIQKNGTQFICPLLHPCAKSHTAFVEHFQIRSNLHIPSLGQNDTLLTLFEYFWSRMNSQGSKKNTSVCGSFFLSL